MKPLSEDEFDELEDFLRSDVTPEECMAMSELDGLLTAAVIGPELIQPSEWLPLVWGETENDEMIWESDSQVQKYMGLLIRYMNSIAALFDTNPQEFEALTYERTVGDKTVRVIDEWCWGFMRTVLLRSDAWKPLFNDEDSIDCMTVVSLYGTKSGREEIAKNLRNNHDKLAELLNSSIIGIHGFWLKRRERSTPPVQSKKFGRNEPCPCGSGKKYKKCCATTTLH